MTGVFFNRLDQGNPTPSSRVEIDVEGALKDGEVVYYTVAMPGIVLDQGEVSVVKGTARIPLDRQALAISHPNFEPEYEVYSVSLMTKTSTGVMAQHLRFRGSDVFAVAEDGAPAQIVCGREVVNKP